MNDLARYGDPLSFCRLDNLTVATLLNTETAYNCTTDDPWSSIRREEFEPEIVITIDQILISRTR